MLAYKSDDKSIAAKFHTKTPGTYNKQKHTHNNKDLVTLPKKPEIKESTNQYISNMGLVVHVNELACSARRPTHSTTQVIDQGE